jgi:hypothetical protein
MKILSPQQPSGMVEVTEDLVFFHGRADASPTRVRSAISSRSNSARDAKIPNTSLPAAASLESEALELLGGSRRPCSASAGRGCAGAFSSWAN